MGNEWPTVRLEDVTTALSDGLHSTPKYDDSGDYYFINENNLKEGRISVDEKTKKVARAEYEKYKKISMNVRFLKIPYFEVGLYFFNYLS